MQRVLLPGLAAALLFAVIWLGCARAPFSTENHQVAEGLTDTPRQSCARNEPHRVALFGDLHVHTALSSDAANYDLAVRPSGAYAYAFGEPVYLPPADEAGLGTRKVQIDRPLDFAAVTDHAEFLAETILCANPDSEVYESDTCVGIRESTAPTDSPLALKIMNPAPSRESDVCGDDGKICDLAMDQGWQETIAAAEEWNDTTSACERTAFIAYEYSSFRLGSNLHRNVIFKNRIVPKRPVSYMDVQREWELWKILKETCQDSETGCDVLAIPHNSNISNGRMFSIDYAGTSSVEEEVARAELRMDVEPIVEVMQHKGDSECRVEMPSVLGATDELCSFEKYEEGAFQRFGDGVPGACYEGPFADSIPHLGPNCLTHRSYVRYALTEGLKEEERIGVNPFKFGLMASTDTHNGLAGGVEERSFPGHLGIADDEIKERVTFEAGKMGNTAAGPGGLIGVWAEENSRDSVFEAMERREVFGTSGPRIQPRFFGSWAFPEDLCGDPELLAKADAGGVPMGQDLPDGPTGSAASPTFAVWATRDPGTATAPGGLLQRIQVIKGWVDEEGNLHEEVVDVAGGPNDATVDEATCEPKGAGADLLCSVWTDPNFDPTRRAVYYARVVENPSCRFSAWQCVGLPEDERPPGCAEPFVEPIQQERAWTSPIWFTPPSS